MGGLREYMPRTYWTFLIATVAIVGVPGTAGFFSKDEILWRTWQHSPLLWTVGFAGVAMTAFYMFRQVFMTFFGECRADQHTVCQCRRLSSCCIPSTGQTTVWATSAPTSAERSRLAFLKTIPATPERSLTTSATTSVMSLAWVPTSSSPMSARSSQR